MIQRVAVTVFRGMVSPRLDAADAIWLYEVENGTAKRYMECRIDSDHPMQVAEFFKRKKVGTIICGGCPRYYMQVLACFGLAVFPGIEGTPDNVIRQFASGNLLESIHGGNRQGRRCRRGKNRAGGKMNNNER